ncbi:MAG: UDP-N-acetylmuramate--L-alanine ligase [Alphaproteobacteria bacterium]|nr:UDP-N-acetylmuramate--L-alanine ligase [Alphaproteobacteria bacterium]
MRHIPPEIGTLHFIGIGGIGMSGIAEVLRTLGYDVQGSDIADSYNVTRLRKQGIRVKIGHEPANLECEDGKFPGAVVVSSAIKADNPELVAARELKLPIVTRAEMLGELMRLKWTVAIGGTHGKTTTTSMVGAMLEVGELDPTVINGGIVNAYGTNTRLGQGDWMVVEADESDGSFTRLPATVAVVTNIDPEHLDHYGSFEAIRAGFLRFIENIPFYGFAVMCSDHPVVQSLIPEVANRRVISYGFNAQADVRAINLRHTALGSTYDVVISGWITPDGEDLVLKDVFLPMMGRHNVQNSLAAIAVGYQLKISPEQMMRALNNFSGVKRRFTRTGISHGITVVDDYAHHPVEISAVLKAARQALGDGGGRVIAVMQPHRYSRLSSLFEEFCTCFNEAESVIIADVYAAGESPIENATKETLVEGILNHGHHDVRELDSPESLASLISSMARAGDFVICLGAGNITQWAHTLPEELETIFINTARSEVVNG